MLNWRVARLLALRFAGLAIALWFLPSCVAAVKIALAPPIHGESTLLFTAMGLLAAGGMLLVGLFGVGLVAYSAGWLRWPR
jgi:hypothetical protein